MMQGKGSMSSPLLRDAWTDQESNDSLPPSQGQRKQVVGKKDQFFEKQPGGDPDTLNTDTESRGSLKSSYESGDSIESLGAISPHEQRSKICNIIFRWWYEYDRYYYDKVLQTYNMDAIQIDRFEIEDIVKMRAEIMVNKLEGKFNLTPLPVTTPFEFNEMGLLDDTKLATILYKTYGDTLNSDAWLPYLKRGFKRLVQFDQKKLRDEVWSRSLAKKGRIFYFPRDGINYLNFVPQSDPVSVNKCLARCNVLDMGNPVQIASLFKMLGDGKWFK